MESAVAHGYLMATVKDYAAKRARQRGDRPQSAPQDWASALRALSGQVKGAAGTMPAPADSPVNGVTPESFRAEVAAMRAAEYERAKAKGRTH